jgi:hypothetical protein
VLHVFRLYILFRRQQVLLLLLLRQVFLIGRKGSSLLSEPVGLFAQSIEERNRKGTFLRRLDQPVR